MRLLGIFIILYVLISSCSKEKDTKDVRIVLLSTLKYKYVIYQNNKLVIDTVLGYPTHPYSSMFYGTENGTTFRVEVLNRDTIIQGTVNVDISGISEIIQFDSLHKSGIFQSSIR